MSVYPRSYAFEASQDLDEAIRQTVEDAKADRSLMTRDLPPLKKLSATIWLDLLLALLPILLRIFFGNMAKIQQRRLSSVTNQAEAANYMTASVKAGVSFRQALGLPPRA